MPAHITCHIKEEFGHSVGGKAGNIAEDHREDQRGEERLNDYPGRSQNGLLVQNGKIALYHQQNKVPVLNESFEIYVKPTLAGFDYRCPFDGRLVFVQNRSSLCVNRSRRIGFSAG